MDHSKRNKIPNAVAIQIIVTYDKGTYGVAYDLEDGKIWKKFDLKSIQKIKILCTENWTNIFEFLTKECPANIVKSIFLNCYNFIDLKIRFKDWLDSVKVIGNNYGYKDFHWTYDFITTFTTELLLARKKCKNYEIGDFVIIGEHLLKFPDSGQIHLLKKQKIGWNVIDGKVIEFGDTVSVLEDFLSKNGIKINNVKDIFVKIDFRLKTHKIISFLKQIFLSEKLSCNVTDDRRSEYFEISGEYLAKVYSGDEYFNDHDCYVGKFCIEKVELQCGNSAIVLPIQFKRLPCIIKKKIRFTKCDGIKLLSWYDHLVDYVLLPPKKVYCSLDVKLDSEIAIVTYCINEHKRYQLKIEKDNDERTLIASVVPVHLYNYDHPRFIFGKDYCSVTYYRDKILWKLKDINGNFIIPFKISFDKEILIGDAAMKYGKYLLNMDVGMLLDTEWLKKMAKNNKNVFVDNFGKYTILVKTIDGIRKSTPSKLCNIFLKSLMKLASEMLEFPVEEIYLTFPYNDVDFLLRL